MAEVFLVMPLDETQESLRPNHPRRRVHVETTPSWPIRQLLILPKRSTKFWFGISIYNLAPTPKIIFSLITENKAFSNAKTMAHNVALVSTIWKCLITTMDIMCSGLNLIIYLPSKGCLFNTPRCRVAH